MNSGFATYILLWIVLIHGALTTGVNAQPEGRIVPVPRSVIYGGEIIADGALTERTLGDSEFNRSLPVVRRADLVGKIARRTLLPGQPVPASAVKAADVIKQGRPTSAVFEAGGLSIICTVVPLQSAAAGDMLSFQNTDSGSVLRGVAQDDGTIRVGSP